MADDAGKEIKTVGDLIAALQAFPSESPVKGTWESVVRNLSVYQAKNGTVLVDADRARYREMFEAGELLH